MSRLSRRRTSRPSERPGWRGSDTLGAVAVVLLLIAALALMVVLAQLMAEHGSGRAETPYMAPAPARPSGGGDALR